MLIEGYFLPHCQKKKNFVAFKKKNKICALGREVFLESLYS